MKVFAGGSKTINNIVDLPNRRVLDVATYYGDEILVGDCDGADASIDCDHDLGIYARLGGNGIKLLDWLAERGTFYPVELHTMNAVGYSNMRIMIERYWS